jgi:hypothetical protein
VGTRDTPPCLGHDWPCTDARKGKRRSHQSYASLSPVVRTARAVVRVAEAIHGFVQRSLPTPKQRRRRPKAKNPRGGTPGEARRVGDLRGFNAGPMPTLAPDEFTVLAPEVSGPGGMSVAAELGEVSYLGQGAGRLGQPFQR